jgi:hypothetical protein
MTRLMPIADDSAQQPPTSATIFSVIAARAELASTRPGFSDYLIDVARRPCTRRCARTQPVRADA